MYLLDFQEMKTLLQLFHNDKDQLFSLNQLTLLYLLHVHVSYVFFHVPYSFLGFVDFFELKEKKIINNAIGNQKRAAVGTDGVWDRQG